MNLSVIIPARNEQAAIADTIRAALAAAARVAPGDAVEILVVDNDSTDATAAVARSVERTGLIRVVSCRAHGAARARNAGARHANGDVLVFIDADTLVPAEAFARVLELRRTGGYEAGISRLAALDGGLRAWCWWTFWDHVRRLPLSRAKAMAAFMFCTREVFDAMGPFDEDVAIAEEWPILAGLYRARRSRFVYDRTLTARSSSRRMEMQRFGYSRNFAKYVWAILHRSGRLEYTDRFRRPAAGGSRAPHTASFFQVVARRVGRLAANARLHDVSRMEVDGRVWIAKRRRWWAGPLVLGWNAWLAVTASGVRVVAGRKWPAWECAVFAAVHGAVAREDGSGGVRLPELPGRPAVLALRDAAGNAEAEDRVLAAVVNALCALHRVTLAAPDGTPWTLSHGDAVLGNVLFYPQTGVARWLDFETRHVPASSGARRRADDLWTLARSAACVLGPDAAERIAEVVVAACGDAKTRTALREESADPRRSRSVLAYARADLDDGGLERLQRAVGVRLEGSVP